MVFSVLPFPWLLPPSQNMPGPSEMLLSLAFLLTLWAGISCYIVVIIFPNTSQHFYCPRSKIQGHPLPGLWKWPLASAWIRKRHPFGAQLSKETSHEEKVTLSPGWLGFQHPLTHLASTHSAQGPCGFVIAFVVFLSVLSTSPGPKLAQSPHTTMLSPPHHSPLCQGFFGVSLRTSEIQWDLRSAAVIHLARRHLQIIHVDRI